MLQHPAERLLMPNLFWKPTVADTRLGGPGINARDHYDALSMVKTMPGLEIVDGDSHAGVQSTPITGVGLQRRRWRRYEIESYLVHPEALERFVTNTVGTAAAAQHVADLRAYLTANLPPAILQDPQGEHPYLNNTKARTEILPPALNAAGLPNLPYTRYQEIASGMLPNEVHADVVQMLDYIVAAFGQ